MVELADRLGHGAGQALLDLVGADAHRLGAGHAADSSRARVLSKA